MKEQLISFETAKLAKEKSFNEKTLYFYNRNKEIVDLEEVFYYGCEGGMFIDDWYKYYNGRWDTYDQKSYVKEVFAASTQPFLQKWLREKYNIHIIIKPLTGDIKNTISYTADVFIFGCNDLSKYRKIARYDTHDEALEKALKVALKLI